MKQYAYGAPSESNISDADRTPKSKKVELASTPVASGPSQVPNIST
jgi:hypothetical protein